MAAQFNQGAPTVPVVLNTSNCFVFGNTASGNALSVQQFGAGSVASFRTTTGATAMFVNAAGNVGINQTTPQTLLHVTATASNSAIMIDNSAVTMSVRPIATNPGSANCHIWADGNAVGTADAGFLRIAAGGGSSTGQKSYIDVSGYSPVTDLNQNIVFGTLGAERMRVDNSGRLGIGTASPQYPLDVAGQPRFSIQPVIQATQLGIASSAAASWYRLASLGPQARAKFRIYTNGANLQEQVVVTTSWSAAFSGYPTVRIEDQSSATFAGTQPLYNGQVRTVVNVNSNGSWYLEVYLGSVAAAYTLYVQLIEGDASGASITLASPIVAGSIPTNYIAQPTVPVNAFSVTPWNTVSNVSLLITNTGNIGIGTTSPGYLMELAGINSTGNSTALKSPHFFSNTYTTGAVINGASTTVSPNALGNFGGQFLYWVNTTTTGQYYSMGVAYTWNPDLQSVNQLLTSGVTTSVSASKLQITNTSGGTLTFYVRILNLAISVT